MQIKVKNNNNLKKHANQKAGKTDSMNGYAKKILPA